MLDDELKHFGKMGMKWGRRASAKLQKRAGNLEEETSKLTKRLDKADSKAQKYEGAINKERSKVERKMAFTFRTQKLIDLNNKLDQLDNEVINAHRPVKAIKSQMERNARMKESLDRNIDALGKKYDKKYFDEITKLEKSNDKSSLSKLAKMKKEKEKENK